ncbi:MAG: SDR family oxidoreductase [Deltaproteobacteria bacterium]|nr:SDR family oxidoreductase [Candidatus Anaeroferrophillus wilburensis]
MGIKKYDLSGQNAIVTGAARGIGAGIAIALAEAGAGVVVSDIIPGDETVATIRAMGGAANYIKADMSEPEDIRRLAAASIEAMDHIDILVNNAGIVHRDSLVDTPVETWDRVCNIIMRGTFLCIQAIYPHMRDRGYGKIINVSSISGIIGGAVSKLDDSPEAMRGRSGPAYAAAKGGVLSLTRWLAKDVAKDGIYVNAIAPGACKTEMTKGFDYSVQGLPIARWGTPEDMADAALFLASAASSYITGQVLNVDGGWVMA